MKREPKGEQDQARHRQHELPQVAFDTGQDRAAQQFPAGKPDSVARELPLKVGKGCRVGSRAVTGGVEESKRVKIARRACDQLFKNPRAQRIGWPKHVGCRARLLPDVQDAFGQRQRVAGEPVGQGANVEQFALRGQLPGGCAIGSLEFRPRPKRGGQSESGQQVIGHRLVEQGRHQAQAPGDLAFILTFHDQPKRFPLLVELLFDGFERGISLTASGTQRVGGGVHPGMARKERA